MTSIETTLENQMRRLSVQSQEIGRLAVIDKVLSWEKAQGAKISTDLRVDLIKLLLELRHAPAS